MADVASIAAMTERHASDEDVYVCIESAMSWRS
jgi:hypothetical protein